MLMVEYVDRLQAQTIKTDLHEANYTLKFASSKNKGVNSSPMVEARRCLWLALIRLDCGHRSMHRSSVSMIEIDLKMWGRSRIDRAQWRFVLQEIFNFTSVNKISVYKAYTLVRTRSERLRRKKASLRTFEFEFAFTISNYYMCNCVFRIHNERI